MNPPGRSPEESDIPAAASHRKIVIWLWKKAKRVVVFVMGSTVVLIGIAMIVLPGPAVIVIPLGLAILATEFVWARKWLDYARRQIDAIAAHASTYTRNGGDSSRPK